MGYHHVDPAERLPANSSEDRLTSEMSLSTSNRSLPSAFSAAASVAYDNTVKYSSIGDFDAIDHISARDLAVEQRPVVPIDDEDDSDDSFIEMSRPKRPESTQPTRSTSAASRKELNQTGHTISP